MNDNKYASFYVTDNEQLPTSNVEEGAICLDEAANKVYIKSNNGTYTFSGENQEKHTTRFGEGTTATGNNQFVVGKYNKDNPDALFTVGNGDASNKYNAFAVLKDGTLEGSNVLKMEITGWKWVASYSYGFLRDDNYVCHDWYSSYEIPVGFKPLFVLYLGKNTFETLGDDVLDKSVTTQQFKLKKSRGYATLREVSSKVVDGYTIRCMTAHGNTNAGYQPTLYDGDCVFFGVQTPLETPTTIIIKDTDENVLSERVTYLKDPYIFVRDVVTGHPTDEYDYYYCVEVLINEFLEYQTETSNIRYGHALSTTKNGDGTGIDDIAPGQEKHLTPGTTNVFYLVKSATAVEVI